MKPLSGLRILEFDGLGPVTFAGMMLADMGAEVLRLTRAPVAGAPVFENVGGEILHRGRASVPVNLKDPADQARVLALVASADALIEGFRPGVMERLGLGPDACAERNPRLVFGRITGWGQTGPKAAEVGHDINYIALSGALSALGEPGRPPRPPLNLLGDYGGGALFLVTGVLAGLLEAKRTGAGRVVDAAMTEGSSLLMSLFQALSAPGLWSGERGANLLDGGAPFYRCYACGDGRFVAVGALEPQFYAALLRGLGIPGEEAPQYDRTAWPGLHRRFETLFAARDRDDWAATFDGSEACVTPVLSMDEAPLHPHNAARAAFRPGSPPRPAPAPRFAGESGALAATAGPVDLDAAVALWS